MQSLHSQSVLPPAVRQLHEAPGLYAGRCSVAGGKGRLIALVLRLGRFPPDAADIPVQVTIDRAGHEWRWVRDFDGHTMRSRLTFDHGAECVREQLGFLSIWLVPEVSDGRLLIHIRRLSVLGIRCPAFLLPRSSTVEWQDEIGHFGFDVSAEMPMLGCLIRYRGWLAPTHNQQGPG
nr:DUF4166 domain-containing protein [Ruegeria arenilitoris]